MDLTSILILTAIGIVSLWLFVFYIYTLIYQAKRKQWAWFVLSIILGGIVTTIYWIVWLLNPKMKRKKR